MLRDGTRRRLVRNRGNSSLSDPSPRDLNAGKQGDCKDDGAEVESIKKNAKSPSTLKTNALASTGKIAQREERARKPDSKRMRPGSTKN